jgi:ABC-type transport system involved in cytochrome c biogenesis permease subunit
MRAETILANGAFAMFLLSAAVQVFFLFKRTAKPDALGPGALLAASSSLFVVLALRSGEVGFIALTGMYESLTFWAAVAGFVCALLFLATKEGDRRLELDRLTYTAIAVGYPFFTAGALVFGAIWAEQAWGRWWSWDPKETWALVTWLVYTGYLHVRLVMRCKGSLPAALAVVGFLCTVLTFFGVNYLLPGLHSYG